MHRRQLLSRSGLTTSSEWQQKDGHELWWSCSVLARCLVESAVRITVKNDDLLLEMEECGRIDFSPGQL